MRAQTRWSRRDKKRHDKEHGMREHGRSWKHLMNKKEVEQRQTPITPGVTRFYCGSDLMVVHPSTRADKHGAVYDNENKPQFTAYFTQNYIERNRTSDRPEPRIFK